MSQPTFFSRRAWLPTVMLSMATSFSRKAYLPLLLLLLAIFSGCSGKKILEEHALVEQQALSVLSPRATLKIESGLPEGRAYHVGVRISETFLNRAASELLKAEVIPATFENPFEISIPPFGTKVAFRPGITVLEPKLTFTGACDECVRVTSRFTGDLALDVNLSSSAAPQRLFEGAALSGDLALNGRVIPMYTGGIPSIGLRLEPILEEDFHVTTGLSIPGLDSLITSSLFDEIRETLANPRYNSFPMLPVRELGVPGSSLGVSEMNYALRTGSSRELFVGLLLSMTAQPQVAPEAAGRHLRNSDFAVVVGQEALLNAARVWMAEGLVPARYDKDGNPAEDGVLDVELTRLELFEDHYELDARLWHTAKPPFRRDYRLSGSLAVRSEVLSISNEEATLLDKAGPNVLVDLALKLQKSSVRKALEGIGRRVPREVGFPFGEPARLKASVAVEEIQTDRQQASIYGAVVFSDAGL